MLLQPTTRLLKNSRFALQYAGVRYRYKKKWAMQTKKKSPSEYALDHFDRFYSQVYGDLWPSIRVSLLSRQKYCAMINNFADAESTTGRLHDLETFDFIAHARKKHQSEHLASSPADIKQQIGDLNPIEDGDTTDEESSQDEPLTADKQIPNLYDFMPVKKIMPEKQELVKEEVEQNTWDKIGNTKFKRMPFPELVLPNHLKAMIHERGVVQKFPQAKADATGKLGYYLMDAASLLPVLALHLTPGCSVLDLCAAPGGKTLAMLQTLMPNKVLCVDHSWSRIQRLKEVLHWYAPKSYMSEGDEKKVEVLHGDANHFCQQVEGSMAFDRVLVDVPCFTDRHVLHEDENNIFRPSRISDRLEIQHLQRDILYAGIRLCKPGGYIVYSTCTLSMPQNDGIIQRTLDKLWQETNINIVVKDTKPFVNIFSDYFNFHTTTRYGQLVLPNLTANFGPIYFSVLQRVE